MRRVGRLGAVLGALYLYSVASAAPVAVLNGPGEIATGVVYPLLENVAVASTGTASSNLVDQKLGGFFGLWYRCSSVSGTAAVGIAWWESPTTEENDFVNVATVNAAVAETAGITTVSPPPMRYGRVVVTGTGANPADTLCTVKLYGAGP